MLMICASLWWKVAQTQNCHCGRSFTSRDPEIRGAIVKTAKTDTILKRRINKFFTIENTYDTKQTDKAREQKFREEEDVRFELKYEC